MARHDGSDESLGLGETPTNAAVEAGPALGSGHIIIKLIIITITKPSNKQQKQAEWIAVERWTWHFLITKYHREQICGQGSLFREYVSRYLLVVQDRPVTFLLSEKSENRFVVSDGSHHQFIQVTIKIRGNSKAS